MGGVAELQQEIQLLAEQVVVVGQVQAEERERLGERPAPYDEVDASLRDQVEGGELLEDPHRVVRAEHRDRTAETNPRRARRGRSQDDRGSRVVVLLAVVLADPEGVQAGGVSQLDLLEQVCQTLGRSDDVTGGRVGDLGDEAVDADVHGDLLSR